MKSKRIIAAIGIALIMVGLTGCGQTPTATNKAVTAVKKTKNMVEASGVVKANNSENIVIDFPQTATPKITKVYVQQGQKVKKEDKLFDLDLTDFNANVEQQQKMVDADQQTKDMDEQAKKADEISKNSLDTDQAKNADSATNSMSAMSKNNLSPDDAKNSMQAKVNADEAKVNADAAKMEADQAVLNAMQAKLNKSYLKGNSIICDLNNAVITDITYGVGDLAMSAKSVATLQDLDTLYIQANVGEEFIKDVQVGKSVQITPTSNTGTKLTGKVTSIASNAVTQNGDTTIPVNISIDKNDGTLLPNYNVDVEIDK